jgi:hypothetical protein
MLSIFVKHRHAWGMPSSVRQRAAIQTGLLRAILPEVCPWTVEQLLENDFFPAP